MMSFRKVSASVIVRCKIMAVQSGLDESEGITTKALEAHYLAGGNVMNVSMNAPELPSNRRIRSSPRTLAT